VTVKEIAGKSIEFDEDGFMVDAGQWDRHIAEALAGELGIDALTERHWKVIEFCRDDYQSQGEAPTLRRIMKAGGIPTKELYQLFPKGPAKKVAFVSGLKKPTGCI